MSHSRHHQHIRKRISNKQPFPHPVRWKRFLDGAVIILGFVNIIATVPQILEIWVGKDATGVSAISWAYYTFFSAVLLLYGYVHHERPIIITYLAGTIMYAIVFIGAIIY